MTPLSTQPPKQKSDSCKCPFRLNTLIFLHIHSQLTSQTFIIFFCLDHYSSLLSGLPPFTLAHEGFSHQPLYSIHPSYADILSVIKRRQAYSHITAAFVFCLAKNTISSNFCHSWLLLILVKLFNI